MKLINVLPCLLFPLLFVTEVAVAGRYYDARTARWLTPDPALRDGDPQKQVKKYGYKLFKTSPFNYSFNNPLKYVDTDGKWPTYIHNRILETAFSGVLTPKQIEILKNASIKVDADQSKEGSYKHAMRATGQSKEDAERKMNEFISGKQDVFISKEGNEALEALGEAMHPLMDATSPAHEGFQEWEGLDNATQYAKGLMHFVKERKISDEKLKETVEKLKKFYEESVRIKEVKKQQKQQQQQ